MSITDKTRKVLWGRSGNLCAFCKAHLVIDASEVDSESVVGDECHIHSGALNGPRHDPNIALNAVDVAGNLILLCRVHHKLVDDQSETFTAESLCQLKANHEKWVKERLVPSNEPESVSIVRNPADIPNHLFLISSAKALLDLSSDCHGRYDDYPIDLSEEELDCVGGFLQNLTDWVDLGINEPYERIEAQKSLAQSLKELDQSGFRAYAARERQELRGGVMALSAFHALHLRIVRHDDPSQVPATANREG